MRIERLENLSDWGDESDWCDLAGVTRDTRVDGVTRVTGMFIVIRVGQVACVTRATWKHFRMQRLTALVLALSQWNDTPPPTASYHPGS